MTLYELLHKVSFDEIAPFLSKSYAEGRSLAWFKMHYDYLCHLVPSPKSETDDDIYVEMVPRQVLTQMNQELQFLHGWMATLGKILLVEKLSLKTLIIHV